MNPRRLFNVVFVTLFCHEPLVCVVAESVDVGSLHTRIPDAADFVRQIQQLLSERERLQDSATKLSNEIEALRAVKKKLEKQLKDVNRASTQDEELKKDKTSSIPSWWRFGPLPRWIKDEEEEIQVINEEPSTLGFCLSMMLRLLLLICQQILNITIILCSDLWSWIGSGWQDMSAIDFSIFSQILEGLILVLMLNSIAYVLLKAKSAWDRNKSFVFSIFKLPIFVCAWGLTRFVFGLLKKTLVINKKQIQKTDNYIQMKKMKKEMDEIRGLVNDLKKQQENDSLENDVRALEALLQQLRIANHPAYPTPERQRTIKDRGRTSKTRSPPGGVNNPEGFRGSRRNVPYHINHNVCRTRWRGQDEGEY